MKPDSRKAWALRRNQPTSQESAPDGFPSADNTAFRIVWTVRGVLVLQVAGFIVLASIHFGLSIGGYRRPAAGVTELAIVAALLVALFFTWGSPARGQRVATAAQLLAALGALVGLVTMTLGVEPGTIPEVATNVVLLLAVTAGLTLTRTWRRERLQTKVPS